MSAKDIELNLINYLLSKNYYHHKIKVDDETLKIIHHNKQLVSAFNKLLASDFASTSNIDYKKFSNECSVFDYFFEYLFYSTESFVRKAAYGK